MPMLNSRLVVPALLVAVVAWGMEPARAFSAPAPASRELPHAGQPFAGASPASQPKFVNPADVEHRLFDFDIENSLVYSFVVLTSSLAAAAIGFRLQRTAPFASLSDEHRSASRAALGLATLLTYIIIGIV